MTSTVFPLTFPFLFDDAFDNAYERMMDRLTTPYYTEPDGNIDKLIQMQALQIEKAVHTSTDIEGAHKLADATGYSLDQWGVLTHVTRRTDESDDDYRARIYTQIAIYMRSATTQDMVSTAAAILETTTDRVTFTDGDSSASLRIIVFLTDIENVGFTLSGFSDAVKATKAGGTDVGLTGLGEFACMNVGDTSVSEKAYNDLANSNPDAGIYSVLI